jgi:hypothetical protein
MDKEIQCVVETKSVGIQVDESELKNICLKGPDSLDILEGMFEWMNLDPPYPVIWNDNGNRVEEIYLCGNCKTKVIACYDDSLSKFCVRCYDKIGPCCLKDMKKKWGYCYECDSYYCYSCYMDNSICSNCIICIDPCEGDTPSEIELMESSLDKED